MKSDLLQVMSNEKIAIDTYEMTLFGELTAEIYSPGSFLHIAVPGEDLVLRRPISVASVNREQRTCKIIYKTVGEGTSRLKNAKAGDWLKVLGPLGGRGFPVHEPVQGEDILLVGGGVGVPPIYYAAAELASRGRSFTVILGFQTAGAVFYAEAFQDLPGSQVVIMTDDGSLGQRGTVVDAIQARETRADWLFSCGPRGMLRAVERAADHPQTRGYVSLEERMGCGVGACLACVCETTDHSSYRKICEDGPVFAFKEVIV